MIVVAIIAMVSALAIPSITSYFQVSLTSASRQIAGTIKETYNATVITGQVHRLAYDLKESTYWVETGPNNVLLDTKESKEREARKKRIGHNEKPVASPFNLDKTVTRKKVSLPSGVTFEDVMTQASTEAITEGMAYSHFFPHGMIEQTIIHLTDKSKHKVSLVILPIIGNTDMYERYLTREEAFAITK